MRKFVWILGIVLGTVILLGAGRPNTGPGTTGFASTVLEMPKEKLSAYEIQEMPFMVEVQHRLRDIRPHILSRITSLK